MAAAVLARPGTPTRLHLARELVQRGHAADEDEAFKRWIWHAASVRQWPPIGRP